MTVTLPAWEALGLAALAVLGASTIAALAMAAVIRNHPAPADPPVPGTTPVPGEAAGPPKSPAAPPAPGRVHPGHGTKLLSADFFEDGVVLVHDHLRRKTTAFEAPAVDLGQDPDEWLKGLTS